MARQLTDEEIMSLRAVRLPEPRNEKFSEYLFRMDSEGRTKGWELRLVVTARSAEVFRELLDKKAKDVSAHVKEGPFYHGGDWALLDIVNLLRGMQIAEILAGGKAADGDKIVVISPSQ